MGGRGVRARVVRHGLLSGGSSSLACRGRLVLGRRGLLRCHFAFDGVDQLEVEFEVPAHEPGGEQEVLLAVRKFVRGLLGLVQPRLEVGDVLAQGGDALAGDLLADEIADQQAQQRLALERCECDGRLGPLDRKSVV